MATLKTTRHSKKEFFFGHPVHDSLNELQKPIDVNYLESTCAKARFDRLEQKDWRDFTLGDLTTQHLGTKTIHSVSRTHNLQQIRYSPGCPERRPISSCFAFAVMICAAVNLKTMITLRSKQSNCHSAKPQQDDGARAGDFEANVVERYHLRYL